MARPTKWSLELQERICGRLADGNLLSVAAAAEGIDQSTLWRWRKRGEQGEPPFDEFCKAVDRAMAEAECEMVGRLKGLTEHAGKGATAMVKAVSWVLERTRRERYAPSITIKVEEVKERLLDAAERCLAPADFVTLLHELERDGAEAADDAGGDEPGAMAN